MPSAKPRPELQPMARAITAAMAAKGLTTTQLNHLLGSTGAHLWITGASRPTERFRDRLVEVLELSPEDVPLGNSGNYGHIQARPSLSSVERAEHKRTRDRERKQLERDARRARTGEAGPAERALVSWAGVPEAPRPKPPASRAASPFSATMHADGTMRITVDVTLPFAQATALMQMLFSAGVLLVPEPAAQEDAWRKKGRNRP